MDLGTILTGMVCVVICASPFVLIGIGRKKKEKQFLTVLKNIAKKHESEITQYEICGSYAIGVDETKKTLIFVEKTEDAYKEQFVDLNSVIDCKTANVYRSIKGNKIIQRLALQLSFADRLKHEVVLEFYNADVNYQLNGEFETIERWNKTINNVLN
ncbi:hypothetical protein [Winogradskyella pulchriflava]|uniref:Uncharacterized protein n=1 Tax=Winogradskyella pulchriflava TaxID=1110688 RepID=A0ABV6QA76_9FLAO